MRAHTGIRVWARALDIYDCDKAVPMTLSYCYESNFGS